MSESLIGGRQRIVCCNNDSWPEPLRPVVLYNNLLGTPGCPRLLMQIRKTEKTQFAGLTPPFYGAATSGYKVATITLTATREGKSVTLSQGSCSGTTIGSNTTVDIPQATYTAQWSQLVTGSLPSNPPRSNHISIVQNTIPGFTPRFVTSPLNPLLAADIGSGLDQSNVNAQLRSAAGTNCDYILTSTSTAISGTVSSPVNATGNGSNSFTMRVPKSGPTPGVTDVTFNVTWYLTIALSNVADPKIDASWPGGFQTTGPTAGSAFPIGTAENNFDASQYYGDTTQLSWVSDGNLAPSAINPRYIDFVTSQCSEVKNQFRFILISPCDSIHPEIQARVKFKRRSHTISASGTHTYGAWVDQAFGPWRTMGTKTTYGGQNAWVSDWFDQPIDVPSNGAIQVSVAAVEWEELP